MSDHDAQDDAQNNIIVILAFFVYISFKDNQ